MSQEKYYEQQITHYTRQSRQIKRQRNYLTLLKLAVFSGLVIQIWHLIANGSLPYFLPALTLLLFILLNIRESKIIRRQQLTEILLHLNTAEKAYLQGDLHALPTGLSYLDTSHPYAHDLDLFGEHSLFQHLNRTVTANGTDLLADWLLRLCRDTDVLLQRQEAVGELAEMPEWCHRFRALGQQHPTTSLSSAWLRQWQEEKPFFPHPSGTRLRLYILNTAGIASWLTGLLHLLPWSVALSFFFCQLLILACYLKKVNAFHNRLNDFIRTTGNYLPLVRLIHQQPFRTTRLQTLQERLFRSEQNALNAFASLRRIQEQLDQRGNILAAFALNGLYLKDLHTLLALDRWQSTYSRHLPAWIDSISEIDAFVSMANYRCNHPEDTLPVFSGTTLFEARDLGHPLLRNTRNVTNDFTLSSLHRLCIVTGANMAGKSTFLRAVGLNLVLAQSGNVVSCAHLSIQPVTLFTSMRTTDNLAKHVSYFHAEILRLRQLVDTARQEERLFIILDEILKGTNSTDKLNGSKAFLQKLLSYPVAGLVATHDLALGELAHEQPWHFFNACFEITYAGVGMTYDYKRRPGV
ncbi:MAG: DNA mismatch repair protein MutS, partial [Odoribacter sp.]|nr:DNA mismatch repair protein MutS [Odoribacter sp.]